MSKDTKFKKGTSGNPKGRPRKEAHRTAYDAILDQTVEVAIDGSSGELTTEEAIEQRLLKDAFAGKAMPMRKVLAMIEKREAFIAKKNDKGSSGVTLGFHHYSENAHDALRILEIAKPDMRVGGCRWNIDTWAAQAALSRPGRRSFSKSRKKDLELFIFDAHLLRWPKGRICDE